MLAAKRLLAVLDRAVRSGRRVGVPVGERRGRGPSGGGRERAPDARRRPGAALREAAWQEPGRSATRSGTTSCCAGGTTWRASCGTPSTATSCGWSSSPWSRCRRCAWSARRRCCAGTIPRWARYAPDEFIPVAEESGLISRIGAWVLERACRQLATWLAEGHDVWVSVNLSPGSCTPRTTPARSLTRWPSTACRPQRLVLEVTEHAVATDMEELVAPAHRAPRHRRADRAGRLRRRLLLARAAAHAAGGHPQDRPRRWWPSRSRAPAPRRRWSTWWSGSGTGSASRCSAEGIGTQAQRAAVEEAGCRLGQGSLFGWGVPAEHLDAQLHSMRTPVTRPVPAPRSAPPPGSVARSQVVMLGPGMRQLRALLPTDPAFQPPSGDQHVGSVDSSREIGQG